MKDKPQSGLMRFLKVSGGQADKAVVDFFTIQKRRRKRRNRRRK